MKKDNAQYFYFTGERFLFSVALPGIEPTSIVLVNGLIFLLFKIIGTRVFKKGVCFSGMDIALCHPGAVVVFAIHLACALAA